MRIVPLAEIEEARVEQLLDRAFGPDRRSRTAYRLRQGTRPIAALSLAALTPDGALVGSIQCWPIRLIADAGSEHPIVMVGPVAVDPAHQRGGIGRNLMRESLDRAGRMRGATGAEAGAMMLIGDPEYYGRFFGFSAERTRQWRLPGPFEPHRLLARGDRVPDLPGILAPQVLAHA